MSQLFVQEKDVVVPGESLAQGMDYLPGAGAYRKGDTVVANRVGLVSINGRAIKLIPLSGPYMAKRDDIVICRVIDITLHGWRLDTNTPNSAMLSMRDATNTFISKGSDLTKILQIGDSIVAGVVQVTTQKLIDVTLRGPGLRKLPQGQIIKFSPNKFPRIIGRQGSMVSMIKRATNCQIVVGQNGLIWMSGEPAMEVVAVEAIRFIEENAHTSGLTDRVKALLESKGLTVPEGNVQDDQPRMQSNGFGGNSDGEQRDGGYENSGSDNGSDAPRREFGGDRPRFGGNRDGGSGRGFGGNRGGFNRDRNGGGFGGNRGGFGGDRPRFERRDNAPRSDAPQDSSASSNNDSDNHQSDDSQQ